MLTMTPSILQYSSVTHFKAAAHPGNGRMLTGGPEAAALNKTITTIKVLNSIVLKKKNSSVDLHVLWLERNLNWTRRRLWCWTDSRHNLLVRLCCLLLYNSGLLSVLGCRGSDGGRSSGWWRRCWTVSCRWRWQVR